MTTITVHPSAPPAEVVAASVPKAKNSPASEASVPPNVVSPRVLLDHVENNNNVGRGQESSSCFGRMWSYIKTHGPTTAKVCLIAMIQIFCSMVALAAAIGLNVAVTSLTGSPGAGFVFMLPSIIALLALARVVSDAAANGLGWDVPRTRLLSPVPLILLG